MHHQIDYKELDKMNNRICALLATIIITLVGTAVWVNMPSSANAGRCFASQLGTLVCPRPISTTIYPKPHWMMTPCATEDSNDCYWNARTMGNGDGRSYFSIRLSHRTCVLYFNTHGDHCVADSNAPGDGDGRPR